MKPDIHAAQQRQLLGLRARLIESIQRARAKRVAAATGKITKEKSGMTDALTTQERLQLEVLRIPA